VRPLPRSLDPLADESLPGFLLRLSHRLEQPPAEIADITGLAPGGIMGRGLLLAIPPGAISRFSAAARLSVQESRALTLSSLGGTYPPLDLAAGGRMRQAQGATGLVRWIFTRHSRYCPECLPGAGAPAGASYGGSWRKAWRLPVTIACQQHRRLLEHLCPQCGVPVHHTAGAGLILRPARILHPAQCRALMPGAGQSSPWLRPACGTWLDQAGAAQERLPASHPALQLQHHMDDLFCRKEGPGERCGSRPDLARQLQDLRTVSCLITMTWPLARPLLPAEPVLAAAFDRHATCQREDIDRRRRQGLRVHALTLYDTPPLDAAACAGLLLAADALLRPEPARREIGELIAAAYPSSALRTFLGGTREFCSPGLREIVEAEMSRLRPPDQRGEASRLRKKPVAPKLARDGWTSYHLKQGHLVVGPEGNWRFDHRHVPQRLPDEWAALHFSDVRGIQHRHLHLTAAIRLAQLSGGGSHSTAGEKLGIPRGTVTSAVQHVRAWTRDPANSLRFATAVREFAERLNAIARPTDYALRRSQLRSWIIPPGDWNPVAEQIAAVTGLSQPDAASQRRRRLFSVLAWAAATSGDPLLAPLVLAEPRPAGQLRQDLSQVRYQARARPGLAAAAVARVAEAYGASLADTIDAALAARSERP
jgi:hypothetical protein